MQHTPKLLVSRTAALSGTLAPLVFLAGLVLASRVEEGFMQDVNWSTWPAGLALGPHGWLWAATSLLFGLLVLVFAYGVLRAGRLKAAAALFAGASAGAFLFALKTDLHVVGERVETANPFNAPTTRGLVHGIGFLVLLPCLVAGYVVLWRAVRRESWWRPTRRYSLAILLLLVPALALPALKPIAGYVSLVLILGPLTILGARLAAQGQAVRRGDGALG